jgi:PAS domain S-box-containing protein
MRKSGNLWKLISDIGIENIPESEKRSVIFLNRINFFIIIISLLGFIGTILVYCVIQGGKPGVGALRLLLMLITGFLSLMLTYYNHSYFAKIVTSVIPLLLLIVLPTVVGDIAIEYYYYYPSAGTASAMIPLLLFSKNEERHTLFILLFFCFALTVTADNLLSYFSESGKIPAMFEGRYFFYKLAQILLFFFIVPTVYTLKDLNNMYESILLEQNEKLSAQKEELTTQSDELLGLNEELNLANSYLAKTNKELENYKHKLEELVELRTSALKDSEERFRNIFENANDAIFIMKDEFCIDCNFKAIEIFGYSKDQIIGKSAYALSPEYQTEGYNSKELALIKIEAVLKGEGQRFEWLYVKADGSLFDAEVSLNTIEFKDQQFLLAIVRDVTQRKKSEYELWQAEHKIMEAVINTEESERSRIAQDLHDGLGPILSTIKLYFQVYKDTNDQEKRNMLSEKLSTTIQEAIKGVSEISHNISPHVLKNYGFYAALKQFIHRIALTNVVQIQLNCLEETELNPNTGIILYRAISELINNSIKHASCNNIFLDVYKKGDFMYVNYADDGRGFDFDTVYSSHAGGSGLNNIVNRVNALKGKIDIKSEVDHGMKALLTIPV